MNVQKDLAARLGTLAFAFSVVAGMTTALILYLAFAQTAHRRVAEKLKLREGWTTYLLEDIPNACVHGLTIPDGNIAVDVRGRVWVAWPCTRTGGTGTRLSVYDDQHWTAYIPKDSGLESDAHYGLVADPQGRVWIYGWGRARIRNRSLAIFDGQTWKQLPFGVYFKKLTVDRRGRIWISGIRNMYPSVSVFEGTSLTTYTPANSGLVNNGRGIVDVADLAVDNQDRVWIAVDDGGVSLFDGSSWVTFSQSPMPFVTKIVFDEKGVAWFGTRSGGLVSYDGVKWTEHLGDTSTRGSYVAP